MRARAIAVLFLACAACSDEQSTADASVARDAEIFPDAEAGADADAASSPDAQIFLDAETFTDAAEISPDAEAFADATPLEQDAGGPRSCPTLGPATPQGNIAVPALAELSGIVVGRKNPDVYWAHTNQSATLFAIDRTTLELRGRYELTDATQRAYGDGDVEDLAIYPLPNGEAELYLADIGSGHPDLTLHIYRALEPLVPQQSIDTTLEAEVMNVSAVRIQNAETLLVDPLDGTLVIVQKERAPSACVLGPFVAQSLARPACDIAVPGIENPSGGDVSPDGYYLALRNETDALIWIRPSGAPLTDAFATTACPFATLATPANSDECNGEALAFSEDGTEMISASETLDCPTANVHNYLFTP